MHSLLIGADGQVGWELRGQLLRLGPVLPTTVSGRLAGDGDCIALDLRDAETVRATVGASGADIVFNAAAYTAVDRAESERDDAFAVNAAAPGVLAAECARLGVPLVHFSTDYVFPGDVPRPLVEQDPVGPLSVYGATKLAGEEAVRAAGGAHKIFRLCWVYGQRRSNFLLTILRLASGREALRVVADQLGCPTPAAWVARAVVHAVTLQPALSGTWHLAASGHTSRHGFAEAIVHEALREGLIRTQPPIRQITTADHPAPARRPAYSVFDCSRFEQDFGVRLPDWRLGVSEVIHAIRGG
jgi:dTDP-4-dehydrorhamnose reductase